MNDEDIKALNVLRRRIEIDPTTGCWNWSAALAGGYGQLTFLGKRHSAHRFSYRYLVGEIPEGMCVLHHCDNRRCVNPDHLYAGTFVDNRRDMLERSGWSHPFSKNTHCIAGHEYTPGSFRLAKDGSRVCRECMKNHMRRWREKRSTK